MKILNRFFKYLKQNFTLPENAKPAIAKRNINVLTFIFGFLLMISLVYLVILFSTKVSDSRIYVYYIGVALISSLVVLLRKPLVKKNNYYLTQIFLMLITCAISVFLAYNLCCSPHYLSGLINVYIAAILFVICFEITPIFYLIYMLFFSILLPCIAERRGIPFQVLANNYIFCVCLIFLSLYKRKAIIKREYQQILIEEQNRQLEANNIELGHQTNSLLTHKQNLEEFVHSQSEEIHLQNEKIIRMQNNTILSLSNLVENRDEDTGDHVLRTRDYVELIVTKAQRTGVFPELTDEIKRLIVKAAPMHDIGKIVVPDSVLKKQGRLTPEEFDLIKLHTTKGGKIVEDVLGAAEDQSYVRIAKEIATSHHEKYNGTGYPYGLSGTVIPLSARIMAIADVFDALVSPRCYKEPMPVEDAFNIITESAGTHFDPILAQLFVDAKDEVIKIHQKYS